MAFGDLYFDGHSMFIILSIKSGGQNQPKIIRFIQITNHGIFLMTVPDAYFPFLDVKHLFIK